ncbi:MAG: DUF3987 domain-containing protein [bacterium]|nr:DUF3987 domain-containing protein [bacterium]
MARKLNDWIDSFLEFTENTEPRRSFRLWTAISTIAAMLQRKCSLPWGHFNIFPNLYVVLVGPSGSRKGTAMNLGYPFLRDLGIRLAAEAITREALIKDLKLSSNTQIDVQGRPLIHCSLTVHSQELTVFLGYNNLQMMADLCDWYDCKDRWTYRTKNQGTDELIGVWVNLLGATTPELLRSTLPPDAIGGGLTARMILVYEKRKAKSVTCPFLTKEELELREVLQTDLEQMLMLAGSFKVSQEYLDFWNQWYPAQDDNPPFSDTRLSGYIERRAIHALKLSIIANVSRTDDMVLKLRDLERAIGFMLDVEKRMSYVFSGVGKAKMADVLVRAWSYIALNHNVRTSDLIREFHNDADLEDMNAVIKTLEQMKVITIATIGNDPVLVYKGTKPMEEKYGIGG